MEFRSRQQFLISRGFDFRRDSQRADSFPEECRFACLYFHHRQRKVRRRQMERNRRGTAAGANVEERARRGQILCGSNGLQEEPVDRFVDVGDGRQVDLEVLAGEKPVVASVLVREVC